MTRAQQKMEYQQTIRLNMLLYLLYSSMLQNNPNERLLNGLPPPPPLEEPLPESTQTPPQLPPSIVIQEKLVHNQIEHQQQNPEKHSLYRKRVQRSKLTYVLKTINVVIGLLFVTFAIFCYTSVLDRSDFKGTAQILVYVMPTYVGISGLIILLIECRMVLMVQYMRFLYNYIGRGLFNIYAGVMPLMMIANFDRVGLFEVITMIASAIMISVGLMYIGLKIFCCEQEGDKIDEENKLSRRENSDSD